MESMQEEPVEEPMLAAGSVEGAWKAVMAWYQPQGDAERNSGENIRGHGYTGGLRPEIYFHSHRGKAQRTV